MISIILIIVFGILFSFFATQNTASVIVHFPTNISYQLPLYLVMLISLGIGVLLISLISIIRNLINKFTMSKIDHELSKTKNESAELLKRIHQLELENTKLKTELGQAKDENSI